MKDNGATSKALIKIDLATLQCNVALDLNKVNGPSRNLCFGGINVWDNNNNFYVPVWSSRYNPLDLAVVKIHVPVQAAYDYQIRKKPEISIANLASATVF